jgi:hypothetical protein
MSDSEQSVGAFDRSWPEEFETADYRSIKFPVPGDWVLGTVEADGASWHYHPEADNSQEALHQYELEGEDFDPQRSVHLARSEDDTPGPSGGGRYVVISDYHTCCKVDYEDWRAAGVMKVVHVGLERLSRGEDLDTLLEAIGREDLEPNLGVDEGQATLTDGGESVSRLALQEKPRLTAWPMKFDSRHVEAIESGQKTVTARLRDEWPDIQAGANLDIFDDEGNFIGHAIVEETEDYPAAHASLFLNGEDGHRNYDLAADFVNDLRRYYPDREVNRNTMVRLVHFSLTGSPSVDDYADVADVLEEPMADGGQPAGESGSETAQSVEVSNREVAKRLAINGTATILTIGLIALAGVVLVGVLYFAGYLFMRFIWDPNNYDNVHVARGTIGFFISFASLMIFGYGAMIWDKTRQKIAEEKVGDSSA